MQKKALIYIVLAGILWGTSGIFVKILTPMGLSVLEITSIRGIVSALFMSGYALFFNSALFKASKKEILLYFCSGLAIFLTSSFYFLSMQASSVSTAVVLMYTSPVFVMIYSVLFLNEKFTSLKFVSLILVMTGSCLVSGIFSGFTCNARGIAFGFGAGLSYSAYNIITKIEMRQKCNPVSASMYSFIFMAIISVFCSQPVGIIRLTETNIYTLFPMLLCGICTCVMPYFLYTLSLKSLPVGTAASLGIIEPVAATLFSVTLLEEKLEIGALAGIVLILTAVFLLSRTAKEE